LSAFATHHVKLERYVISPGVFVSLFLPKHDLLSCVDQSLNTNQSINQSIIQSINQSINQSIYLSISQINQSIM